MKRVVDTPGLACPTCGEEAPAVELTVSDPPAVPVGPGITVQPNSEVSGRTAIPCGHALASLGWQAEGGYRATALEAGGAAMWLLGLLTWTTLLGITAYAAAAGGWVRAAIAFGLIGALYGLAWIGARIERARPNPEDLDAWRRRPFRGS